MAIAFTGVSGVSNGQDLYREMIQHLIARESRLSAVPAYFPPETERAGLYQAFAQFYRNRQYTLAWLDLHGSLPQADSLWDALEKAPQEGLTAHYYRTALVAQTQRVFDRAPAFEGIDTTWIRTLVTVDFRLTAAYLRYASHLLSGQVDPARFRAAWYASPRTRDLGALLQQALLDNRIASSLQALRPAHRQYKLLKGALAHYEELAERGGWPALPADVVLQRHDANGLVPLLRQRLTLTGDYAAASEKTDERVFDAALAEAVKRYQRRNGLKADGVVGPNTVAMLNMPVEKRIEQLRINLERIRWLPDPSAGKYVLVNVPEYRLRVKEGAQTVLDMKVIVGKEYHSTPVFRDTITYLVFNPTWTVPLSIARNEMLPRIKRNPRYLARNGYQVYRSWRDNTTAVDPDSVNWQAMSREQFNWRIVKKPGPGNPLGVVKFMFPNPLNIYLHDTPKHGLFNRKKRAFSHGCVRVARPVDLAAYLLQDSPEWDRTRIRKHLGRNQPAIPVVLPEPVPVQFIYRTAFVDEQDRVNFRPDVYGHDERQIEVLQ